MNIMLAKLDNFSPNMDARTVGTIGEYITCIDLLAYGYVAYPAGEYLPYDIVLDLKNTLLKVQVKTTKTAVNIKTSSGTFPYYRFGVKCGKRNKKVYDNIDIFAFVALDTMEVGYLHISELKQCLLFRTLTYKGTYPEEMLNTRIAELINLKSKGLPAEKLYKIFTKEAVKPGTVTKILKSGVEAHRQKCGKYLSEITINKALELTGK